MAITVIIPTYKEPEHLKLCIDSALATMVNKNNQILVYVDGTGDMPGNQAVIKSYIKEKEEGYNPVTFIIAAENHGMCRGMNYAISHARHRTCLIVNDDHVFPKNWDLELENHVKPRRILVLNTIERKGSMFKGVEIQDFGTCPADFRMADYLEASYDPDLEDEMEVGLCRLPFVVDKYEYMALEGWDERLIHGLQADDDFFLKAKLAGYETLYIPQLKFYHFSMTTVNNDNLAMNGKQKRTDAEQQNFQYLYHKWGGAVPRNNGSTVQLVDPVHKQIIIP